MSDPSSTLAGSSPGHPPMANGNHTSGPSTPPRTINGDIQMNGGINSVSDGSTRINGESQADMSRLFMARREEELARRDRSLAEFLIMLDGYKPVVSEDRLNLAVI